jgi:hypothetical protein
VFTVNPEFESDSKVHPAAFNRKGRKSEDAKTAEKYILLELLRSSRSQRAWSLSKLNAKSRD